MTNLERRNRTQWRALVARLADRDAAELEAMKRRALYVAKDASTMALLERIEREQPQTVAAQAQDDDKDRRSPKRA